MTFRGLDNLSMPELRTVEALTFGTVLFGALVQLETFLLYARGAGAAADATLALALPFLQLDSLLLGAALGGAYLLVRKNPLRFAVVAAAVVVNVWAVVNQVGYYVLRQNLSVFDPDIQADRFLADAPALLGSVAPPAFALAVVNLLVLAVGAWMAWRRTREGQGLHLAAIGLPARPRTLVAVALAYGVLSLAAQRAVDTRGLERHAVVAALTPVHSDAALLSRDSSASAADSSFRRPLFGTPPATTSDARLADAVSRARALRRPNVLLVVLESVGSEQLFPGGVADTAVTPNVARLMRRGVLFPNIYAINTATTRAHVPMMTGGPALTWGDAVSFFEHSYRGASLPGELHRMGYRTGLFAATDLGFALLQRFYSGLPWDTLLHYGNGRGPLLKSELVHSWGVNEAHLWSHAKRWVEAGSTQPFFLDFQTISTHHPYGTPLGFRSRILKSDAQSRYLNAIAYTDSVLGQIMTDLESRGELERTIVIITGDHGEAFSERHAQNLTHRNYLFEENVRSFLLFAVPRLAGPIVSPRIGTHADLMPSLLALLGGAAPAVEGQNLFAPDLPPRPAYFYKDVPPSQWALRDGQWKFIDRRTGDAPELYDLNADPDEHANLAAAHGDMVTAYRDLLRTWYVRTGYDFTSHLDGLETIDIEGITPRGTLRQGLRDVRVGSLRGGGSEEFVELTLIPSAIAPTVDVRWFALDRDTEIRVRVVSPTHRLWVYPMRIEGGWSSTRLSVPLREKETGKWTVDVWSGVRKLGRTTFEVP